MKLFAFVAVSVSAQANLDTRIANAQDKCAYFMDKAFYCEPPASKIGKYTFRLNKVIYFKPVKLKLLTNKRQVK
jgi:hypothetical protein